MLHLILKSYTDEGFGRNVYQKCFSLNILYLYIYIETQKKHIRLNVSAKAFISMTFQNPTEHTYRFRISKTIHMYIYIQNSKMWPIPARSPSFPYHFDSLKPYHKLAFLVTG